MRLFDYETKKVIEESDQAKANELIDAGKAVKLDLSELDEFQRKSDNIYHQYNKQVAKVRESDNPLLQDEKVRKYELDRLEKEYRKQSQEVEEAYQKYRKQSLEDAKVRAAQASVRLTDKDKLTAEQFATRASLELAGAYEQDKSKTVKRIVDDIRLLTDEQRTALQANASQLLVNIDDVKDKRKLINAMQEVRNPDLLALEVANQLPRTVLTMQRVREIAKKTAVESIFSHQQGIGLEFYEEHLKQ